MRASIFHAAVLAGCVALLAAPLAAHAGDAPGATAAAIRAENARWAAAYARGDYAAIGALYTADGTLLPPGEDRVVGPAAIAAYFTRRAEPGAARTVRFGEVEVYGDTGMATEISDTEIRDSGGRLVAQGKQTLVFLKRNGAWKLHRDMWNANAPHDRPGN
ncbi:MAG: nuclear transport factor 2 family protein [Burkholderia gladioli]